MTANKIFLLIFITLAATCIAKSENEKAILLVSFGTSYPDARMTLHSLEPVVKQNFPGYKVTWAYTSSIIRNKLKKQGIKIDSPEYALIKLIEDGVTDIYVQPLHIIPGEEYNYLKKITSAVSEISKSKVNICLGTPLLYYQDDLHTTAGNMLSIVPVPAKDEAVIWMAHGTTNPSEVYYPALQQVLNQQSDKHYIATVEYEPSLDSVLQQLKTTRIKKIHLIPFLTIAGDHALNDMAGDEPDSWKNKFEKQGYKVTVTLKGINDYEIFKSQWINKIKHLINENNK